MNLTPVAPCDASRIAHTFQKGDPATLLPLLDDLVKKEDRLCITAAHAVYDRRESLRVNPLDRELLGRAEGVLGINPQPIRSRRDALNVLHKVKWSLHVWLMFRPGVAIPPQMKMLVDEGFFEPSDPRALIRLLNYGYWPSLEGHEEKLTRTKPFTALADMCFMALADHDALIRVVTAIH